MFEEPPPAVQPVFVPVVDATVLGGTSGLGPAHLRGGIEAPAGNQVRPNSTCNTRAHMVQKIARLRSAIPCSSS